LVRAATALTFRDVLLLDDRRERQIQIDFVPSLGSGGPPGRGPPRPEASSRSAAPLLVAPGDLAVMFDRFWLALT
jgi:hypothetical protein